LIQVEQRILRIRSRNVMLDFDLAELYGVETGALKRAVNRNRDRFPEDFAFQVTAEEMEALRCQIGTSKQGRGGRRYLSYAFTEQGVAMLSSVLRSARAVQVNIAIMRAFVRLREIIRNRVQQRRRFAPLLRAKLLLGVPRMESLDTGAAASLTAFAL